METRILHRMSDVDTTAKLATCGKCGPNTPVRYKKCRDIWVCVTSSQGTRVNERKRERRLRTYSLTPEQYDAMLADQSGVCAICGGLNKGGRTLAVDHDHATGKVRGILCGRCNTSLGLMGDSPERLLRAVQYLA